MIYGTLANERFTYGLGGRRISPSMLFSVTALSCCKRLSNSALLGRMIKSEIQKLIYDELKTSIRINRVYALLMCTSSLFTYKVELRQVQNIPIHAFFCNGSVLLADNDEPGRRVANIIQSDLQDIAKSAKVIVPVTDIPKADISDYFAAGNL